MFDLIAPLPFSVLHSTPSSLRMTNIGTLYLSEKAAATPKAFHPYTPHWNPWLTLPQIKAIAVLAGVTFDTPQNYIHYETNKTPEFTSKFAHGKVPALETPDGFFLAESTAVIRYS